MAAQACLGCGGARACSTAAGAHTRRAGAGSRCLPSGRASRASLLPPSIHPPPLLVGALPRPCINCACQAMHVGRAGNALHTSDARHLPGVSLPHAPARRTPAHDQHGPRQCILSRRPTRWGPQRTAVTTPCAAPPAARHFHGGSHVGALIKWLGPGTPDVQVQAGNCSCPAAFAGAGAAGLQGAGQSALHRLPLFFVQQMVMALHAEREISWCRAAGPAA